MARVLRQQQPPQRRHPPATNQAATEHGLVLLSAASFRGLLLLLLPACLAVDKMPDPPDSSWLYLKHHSVGNAAICGTGTGKCSNLDPPNQLEQKNCPASPGATKCMEQATKDCAERPTCVAFAFLNLNSEGTAKITRYQMWDAGIANAVPNNDWYLYAKAKDCSTCPAGSIKAAKAALPDSTAPLRPAESYQCADKGNGMKKKTNAVIFCRANVSWGEPLLVVLLFMAPAYVVRFLNNPDEYHLLNCSCLTRARAVRVARPLALFLAAAVAVARRTRYGRIHIGRSGWGCKGS